VTGVDYTIVSAQIKKTLEPTAQRPNALIIWDLQVQDPSGATYAVERSKRPENKLVPGQVLHGYIEAREGYPDVLKEVQRNGQPQQGYQQQPPAERMPWDNPSQVPQGYVPPPQMTPPPQAAPPPAVPAATVPGPTGKPPGDQYDRRPDHPLNVVRMRHAAALGSAPDYYRLLREEMLLPKPGSLDQMQATLKWLWEWLEGSYPKDPRDEQIPF
jgi:hypothetical protein